MLYVVVGRGEGRDVRQGGAAHRGVGALALGHALGRGNFVMPSLFIHSKKVNIMIATDTLTSADRFFLCISSGIKSLTLSLYVFFELHLLETHDVNIKIIKRIVNINSVVNFLFLFFIFISFTFSSVILYLH